MNKAFLSKLRVSFEYLFAGQSVLVFGNQNMVTLLFAGLKKTTQWQ